MELLSQKNLGNDVKSRIAKTFWLELVMFQKALISLLKTTAFRL